MTRQIKGTLNPDNTTNIEEQMSDHNVSIKNNILNPIAKSPRDDKETVVKNTLASRGYMVINYINSVNLDKISGNVMLYLITQHLNQ
ncbi:hypothetical protein AB6F61_18445 [Providencia hangzhouensis]|uniref:hypothetical protein n=1 Tax=Providencia hangzhouensis TaxID=3031799 RepID=UPI0034DCD4E6